MSYQDHIPFAFKSAHALVRGDDVPRAAIACLRELVEARGASVEDAISAVTATFPLGLNELGSIASEARRRYAREAA